MNCGFSCGGHRLGENWMKFSICVPVYNAAERIRPTLDAVHRMIQHAGYEHEVELIVVDNASTDGTTSVVEAHWENSVAGYRRCIVSQPKKGATFARLMGWISASGDIIVFCDDDVSPAVDSLTVISEIAQRPDIGGGGGRIHGQLEGSQKWPEWFDSKIKGNLAINESMANSLVNPPTSYLPVSAFVWFRREALRSWAHYYERSGRFALGPSGQSMWRADDQEMDVFVLRSGFRLKFDPRIQAFHRIPSSRLRINYMLDLMYWNGRSLMRMENRWFDRGWFYCASRVIYHLTLGRIPESWSIVSGWGRKGHKRFRVDESMPVSQINARMHFAFRAGVFDEMCLKTVLPGRW